MDNADRIEHANQAIEDFMVSGGLPATKEALIDTVTNLRHYCSEHEVDFLELPVGTGLSEFAIKLSQQALKLDLSWDDVLLMSEVNYEEEAVQEKKESVYVVALQEVVYRDVFYAVSAASEEEARELAGSGETLREHRDPLEASVQERILDPNRGPWLLGEVPADEGCPFIAADFEARSSFNRDEFHDFVVAHGLGAPTEEGYEVGERLMASGDDNSTASFEVVSRGLTRNPEVDAEVREPGLDSGMEPS